MADDVKALVLSMSADLRKFEKSMGAMSATANKRLTAVEARAIASQRNLSRIMDGAGRGMVGSFRSALSGLAPTIAAAFSAQQVIKYADAYTSLQNRLKATGLEGAALKRVEDGLYEAANRNGVAVEATASLYQRAAMARQNLGASEEQLMQIVSGTSAALKLQGTSAGEASGALLQLGQLLGGNMVQSQEYNSLIDGLPTVLEAVAKGSDRWGGSVNKLTQDVKAGKVSSQEFFQAALKGYADIEARAGQSTTTVGAALQTLNNQLGRYIGQTDSSMSATARMAQGIELLANNLDTAALIVGVLAGVFGAKFVLSMTAGIGAMTASTVASARFILFQAGMTASMTGTSRAAVITTGAIQRMNIAIAANPLGAALLAAGLLAGGLVWLKSEYGDTAVAARELDRVVSAGNTAIDEYRKAMDAARAASGKERADLVQKAKDLRAVTDARIEDARVAAQVQINEAVAARKAAEEAEARANQSRSRGGSSEGSRSVQFGMDRTAQGARDFANRSQAQADAGISGWQSLLTGRNAADNPTAPLAASATPDGKGKKSVGPTPEELAAQRQMLRLQGELDVLRAQGNEDAIRAKQREIDLINLTKSYTDAGFENAAQQARDQVDNLAAAEAITREIDENLEQSARRADRNARTQQYLVEQQQRENDLLMDRLGYEAELARLSGDPQRLEAAERELFIEGRINDLLRDREGLITAADRAAAQTQAENEWREMDSTQRQGRLRDEFRNSFRDGIKAAIDGDMGGLFESLADRFTDRMLDNLADDLFDLLAEAAKGMGKGGGGDGAGWMSAIASMFSKGFDEGGYTGAGGKNQPAGVVHKGEVVFSKRDVAKHGGVSAVEALRKGLPGYSGGGAVRVISGLNSAMRGVQSPAGGRMVVDYRVTVSPERDSFIQLSTEAAGPMVAQGAAAAYSASRNDQISARRRSRQRFM
jgi:tape measure domain-containing protein